MDEYRLALEMLIRSRLENAIMMRGMQLVAKRLPRDGDQRLQRLQRALDVLPGSIDTLQVLRRNLGRPFTIDELLSILAP